MGKKFLPKNPQILKNGKFLSTNKFKRRFFAFKTLGTFSDQLGIL
jgi:hypothetical protein